MSYIESISSRMAEAVAHKKVIVINPAFSTIPDSHAPNILNIRQAKGLADIFGQAAAQWEQDHYGQYEEFQVGTASRLVEVLRTFKRHPPGEGDKRNLDQRLMISQNRTIIPWSRFFPKDDNPVASERSGKFHITDLFQALYANAERQPGRQRVPSLAPVLRSDITISWPDTKKLKRQAHLVTGRMWPDSIEDQPVKIQDILRVRDKTLRHQMLSAESFSFVATPFLERWNLASVLHDNNPYPVCVFWDISSEKQLYFPAPEGHQ